MTTRALSTEARAARLVAELETAGKTVHAVRINGRAVEVVLTPDQAATDARRHVRSIDTVDFRK